MRPAIVAGLATGAAIPACGLYRRYRRDMNVARARLSVVDRHVISTPWGAVEYAERGSGDPVLVVHGIFHNCVGGLLSVRDVSDRRCIAASRFGYLGSNMPPDATPAHQADALASLLDALDIGQADVIGESAGATSPDDWPDGDRPRRTRHVLRREAESWSGPAGILSANGQENPMLPALFVIVTYLVLYWFPIRRWMNQWGAAPSDLARVMAGDSLLADHTYSGTTAVIVNARPEHIWPWLVQMGYQRGGLYSYDWLDRLFGYLDRPSATRILPEFQHLAVGEHIQMGRGPGWPVAVLEPNRALVLDMRNLGGIDWVWQFGLYQMDETRTQLVSRSRVRARSVWAHLLTHAIEPAGFLMTRRMLLGLKQRAEALRSASVQDTAKSRRSAA